MLQRSSPFQTHLLPKKPLYQSVRSMPGVPFGHFTAIGRRLSTASVRPWAPPSSSQCQGKSPSQQLIHTPAVSALPGRRLIICCFSSASWTKNTFHLWRRSRRNAGSRCRRNKCEGQLSPHPKMSYRASVFRSGGSGTILASLVVSHKCSVAAINPWVRRTRSCSFLVWTLVCAQSFRIWSSVSLQLYRGDESVLWDVDTATKPQNAIAPAQNINFRPEIYPSSSLKADAVDIVRLLPRIKSARFARAQGVQIANGAANHLSVREV